jgi:transposase-like protein
MANQVKTAVNTMNGARDRSASQGARRATGEADGSAPAGLPVGAEVEVMAHAKRRQFSNAEKRRILAAADRCRPGELGALLRREGVYSSSLSTWRRQREAGERAALAPQKRGPKADPDRAEAVQIAKLTRENERLKDQLEKARLIIDVQKKVAALMGHTLDENGERI